MVMGIAPAEPQESVRFEEGNNSDFQDVEETAAHSQESPELPENPITGGLGNFMEDMVVLLCENVWRG